MKHLGPVLTLSLFSFTALANYPDEINYPHYQRIYQTHSDDLSRLTTQYQNLDSDSRRLQSDIQSMQNTFNNYSNERVNINNTLRNLSDENRQLAAQRDQLVRQERSLNLELNSARSESERYKREFDNEERRIRPLRDQMNRVNNELSSLRNNQNQAQRNYNAAQNDLRLAESNLSRIRSDISRLESTPNRTPSQQSTLDNLYRQRSQAESEVSRKRSDVSRYQSTLSQLTQQVSSKENEYRNLQNQYNRESARLTQLQTQVTNSLRRVNDLEKRIQLTRSNLTNTDRRISSVRSEITRLESRRSDIDRAQNTLRGQIDSSINRYNIMVRELQNLYSQVERKRVEVSNAQYEYEKRAELYERFYVEAQELGRSQVSTAQQKGYVQGEKDAEKKGTSLGLDIGKKLGFASANLWGSQRAEVLGYHEGYTIGYNSPKTDAQNAADKDAAKAAKSYVETQVRPVYFEEVVQTEIKKPFTNQKKLETPFTLRVQFSEAKSSLELTDEEISASDNLITPYDSVIAQFKKERNQLLLEFERVAEPVNSYAQQESYPYDKFNCSNVYKGVSDFKKACEDQFYSHYAHTFESAAYSKYSQLFTGFFESAYESAFEDIVQKQYNIAFTKAYDVTKGYGEEVGKKVMYDEAYEAQYNVSYPKHVELEKKRVRTEVEGEFARFLEQNALLTMVSLETDQEIIAGDTISVKALIRNLGMTKSGIAHLNIIKAEGASVLTPKVTTEEIKARSQTKVVGPVIKVNPELTSGSRFKVEVEASLPGDNYQSVRRERIVLERKVDASPQQTLKLNVDQSPSIRNVLRRFLIHTLSVETTPKYEDMKNDLDVNLVALRGTEHIEFKVTNQKIQKLKKGQKSTLKFSYVFKDSAKGETVVLALQFLYKGRVIQSEQIELNPH